MAKLSRHILFVVQMILRHPEMPFNGMLFLRNKYATLGITARSESTAKYPDLSPVIWHISQSKFHRVKVCQYHVYWIPQMKFVKMEVIQSVVSKLSMIFRPKTRA